MLYPMELTLDDDEKVLNLAKALSSPIRIDILKLLIFSSMSVKEIALTLGQPISSTALNINLLEQAGLLFTEVNYTTTGKTRTCYRSCDKVVITLFDQLLEMQHERSLKIEHNIPIGSFSAYENLVAPCGIVSKDERIGLDDDVSLFFSPRRFEAALMWFSKGRVEYRVSTADIKQDIKRLELSFEACSEAPLYNNDFKSDITVWINDIEIGTWVCPGDFGGRRGQFNPPYWPSTHTQYGILTNWHVTDSGTTMNNQFMSYVNLKNLDIMSKSYVSVKIGVKHDAVHCGGINIFGTNFGDYAQDIIFRIIF